MGSDKIKTLEELAKIAGGLHTEGRSIVLSHGIFDNLHDGHMAHLQAARKLGDVLIVSVTTDAFVLTTSHELTQDHARRADALAALSLIDYVVLADSRNAVGLIEALRPTYFAKGTRYIELANQHELELERQAVTHTEGVIVFTDEGTVSDGNGNKYLPGFSQEVQEYLGDMHTRYSLEDIQTIFEGLRGLKTLVIGESIIDEYRYCRAIGKSSKEPTLVVKHLYEESYVGGILAVANHVAGFIDGVTMVTQLGDHDSQEAFVRSGLRPNVTPHFIYRKDSPTIVKRRYVESYFFTKMFEVYEINDDPLHPETNESMCAALETMLPEYDVVIVADFGNGMISPEAIQIISEKSPFLALNVQSNAGNAGYHTISAYPRADYVCISENEIRLEARDRVRDARDIIQETADRMGAGSLMITQGRSGSLFYSQENGFVHTPAIASRVVDRIGAGDALLSITSLLVRQGVPADLTGFIGNAVGAIAVATVGNREAVRREVLEDYIEALIEHGTGS